MLLWLMIRGRDGEIFYRTQKKKKTTTNQANVLRAFVFIKQTHRNKTVYKSGLVFGAEKPMIICL